MRVMDLELAARTEIERGNGHPGDPTFREAGRKLVTASAVGHADRERRLRSGIGSAWSSEVEVDDVAEAIPGEARLLCRCAAAVRVDPVGVVIRAALVG